MGKEANIKRRNKRKAEKRREGTEMGDKKKTQSYCMRKEVTKR
jgi:hypothetical protein